MTVLRQFTRLPSYFAVCVVVTICFFVAGLSTEPHQAPLLNCAKRSFCGLHLFFEVRCAEQEKKVIFQLRVLSRLRGVIFFYVPQQPRRPRKGVPLKASSYAVALCGWGMSHVLEGTRWSDGTLPAAAAAEHSVRLWALCFIAQRRAGLTFRAPRSRRRWRAAVGEETPQEPALLVNQREGHRGERLRDSVDAAP